MNDYAAWLEAMTYYKRLGEIGKSDLAKKCLIEKIKAEEDAKKAFDYVRTFQFLQKGFRFNRWDNGSCAGFLSDRMFALELLGIEIPEASEIVLQFLIGNVVGNMANGHDEFMEILQCYEM